MISRLLALVFLVFATMVSLPYVRFVIRPDVQLILGTVITLYIVMWDAVTGFIFGLSLLILYLRVYGNTFGLTWNQVLGIDRINRPSSSSMPYITPEHLESAQNNIVNQMDYNTEMKGITGVYGEEVYSAQGTDSLMPGFENTLRGEPIAFE